MNELSRVLNGLAADRQNLTVAELLAMESPSAEFEAHVPSDIGGDFWIYSVNGKAFNGDFIVVRAPKFMPQIAEDRAQEGLRETIKLCKALDTSTGLQATVEVRGVE
jgi:hypothetical protein